MPLTVRRTARAMGCMSGSDPWRRAARLSVKGSKAVGIPIVRGGLAPVLGLHDLADLDGETHRGGRGGG
jgi:hypothetical protein